VREKCGDFEVSKAGRLVRVRIAANAFLTTMVSNLVGKMVFCKAGGRAELRSNPPVGGEDAKPGVLQ